MAESVPSPPENRALSSASRTRLFRYVAVVTAIVLVVLCAVGAEWAARSYERRRAEPPDYFPQIFYPHQRLRYGLIPSFNYYGWFKINSLGFRGPEVTEQKQPDVLRIVCLGGSTTFDIGSVGRARPWPEVLQGRLRRDLRTQSLEVLNLGLPGATSLDSLVDLQIRGIKLDPDVVIVYQAHNDLMYSTSAAHPTRSSSFPSEVRPRSSFTRWLTNHSLLYAKTAGRISNRLGGLWKAVVGVPNSGSDRDAEMDRREAGLERGLADFELNLRSIAAVARANHIPLVLPQIVLPFPETSAEGCRVCTEIVSVFGIEPARLRSTLARYDSVLQQLAVAGDGVYYVPTDGFVPNEDRYYHDPIHFGPEGSMRMGEGLSYAIAPILTR